jgi:hypothetical protein
MSKVDGQEAAFPVVVNLAMDARVEQGGLTKRELFAAMAMLGLVVAGWSTDPRSAAELAVKHAAALLAALEKES